MNYFSIDSESYSVHRPSYPPEIFQYLYELRPFAKRVWDCGCGNGQASIKLAKFFHEVIATDSSKEQIAQAKPAGNIIYKYEKAESTSIATNSIDLIVVAQALHWFNFEIFYKEVLRVCKASSLFAAITYNLFRINPEIDEIIDDLYWNTLKGYWSKRRSFVDTAYEDIRFPFKDVTSQVFTMTHNWNFEHLIAYLQTWSGVKDYIKKNKYDPVEGISDLLYSKWNSTDKLQVKWDVTVKTGIIN